MMRVCTAFFVVLMWALPAMGQSVAPKGQEGLAAGEVNENYVGRLTNGMSKCVLRVIFNQNTNQVVRLALSSESRTFFELAEGQWVDSKEEVTLDLEKATKRGVGANEITMLEYLQLTIKDNVPVKAVYTYDHPDTRMESVKTCAGLQRHTDGVP